MVDATPRPSGDSMHDRLRSHPLQVALAVVSMLTACALEPQEQRIAAPTSALMLRADWDAVYGDVREGHRYLERVFGNGQTLASGCAVESHRGNLDLCLEVDHMPDLADSACPSDFASYAWVSPQVRTAAVMAGGSASVMLFYDAQSSDDVCIQVYSERAAGGSTCWYQDCLVNGGVAWMDVVLDVYLPMTAADVKAALDEAGPTSAPDAVHDAIMYLLGQSARGLLALEL
jgi:hypothetical protein